MAKKPSKSNPPARLVDNTSELVGDSRNPRKISAAGAEGLAASLDKFGDLSGITYNRRTGELVTGHQRMEQIRAQYGDRDVEVLDAAAGIGAIRVDETHVFPVRVVDWTPAKQRAANVAANNHKIQGKFTEDLSAYLLEVEAELAEELPGVLDDCLLVELLAVGLDTSDAAVNESEPKDIAITESFQVLVQCNDEAHQKQIYDQLTGEGLCCKVLTL